MTRRRFKEKLGIGLGEEVGDRVAWALGAPAGWGSSLAVITRDWTQIGHGRE